MADVTVKYKGNVIAELSEEGTKTLKTSGRYCEGDISVSYSPPISGGGGEATEVNCKAYSIALAKKSGWVELVTLDSDVLAHINDASFKVMLATDAEYAYEWYSGSFFVAANTPFANANGNLVYGYANRQSAETTNQNSSIFYPANNTGTSETLGGYGLFRVNDGKYYLKPSDGYVRAGTYKLVFTW